MPKEQEKTEATTETEQEKQEILTEEKTTEDPAKDPAKDPTEQSAAETGGASHPDAFAEIGAAFVQDWPKAADHFVNEVKAEAQAAEDQETGKIDFRLLKDSAGHYFNPEICKTEIDAKTGIPVKTKRGLWELQRGKKRKDLSKRKPTLEKGGDAIDRSLEEERAAAEAARQMAEKNAETVAAMGDFLAWIAIEKATGIGADAETQKQGKAALKLWLLSLERMPEPPPWVMPVFIYGQAFVIRFQSEKAEPKRQAFREKIGNALAYWKGKRAAKKEQKKKGETRNEDRATYADCRQNG